MIMPARLEGLFVLGWPCLAVTLLALQPAADVSASLLTLALAEAVARLLVPHPPFGAVQRPTARFIERILLAWILLVPALFWAWHMGYLLPYRDDLLTLLCLLALLLVTPVLRLIALQPGPLRGILTLRLFVLSAVCFGWAQLDWISPAAVHLSAVLMAVVLCLCGVRRVAEIAARADPDASKGPAAQDQVGVLHRHADLFMVPFLFPPALVFPYLLARGLAAGVHIVLDYLTARARLAVGLTTVQENVTRFPVAEAARLNLGAVLLGGAVALGTVSTLPYVLERIGALPQDVAQVVHWLILGALGPAIFGIVPVWAGLADLKGLFAALTLTSTVLLIGAVVAGAAATPLGLAQITAAAQLTPLAVLSGMLVRRAGVWPGLTALAMRQIKLF